MKEHLANAGWGVLDYVAYPLGMLLVAPVILRNMGSAQYGVWMVATAAVTIGSIIACGFSDANIQQVAHHRGRTSREELLRTVRCMVAIHLLLATVLGLLMWCLAPHAAGRVVSTSGALRQDCLRSFELAAALLWVRAMESVCISTQRAFARYGEAVRISALARLLSLIAAASLTYIAHSVAAMLAAALVLNVLGTRWQYVQLQKLLGGGSLLPAWDGAALKALIAFGSWSWLLAVSGIIFSQVDRLYLGVSTGAVAVASYALCTQLAQPIYGIAASGLHFLFPYLAERRASHASSDLRSAVLTGLTCNLLFVAAASAVLVFFGPAILRILAGKEIAADAAPLLHIIVAGTAIFAMSVTATYALFAFRRVGIVTALNLAGGAVMFLLMLYLTPRMGAFGPAYARLSYGVITLCLYIPLVSEWKSEGSVDRSSLPAADAMWEEI
ncbi:MAG TPA: oligosaccharide flippase family protein [Acidobacteriaceae bacterium]